ncbi:EF-P lysine aminoacylase GenX [Gammaproteobacteria bacterium]|nr:EF-P lysine aminoacylase GenX [Gammaproteobacteria bacterium]
MSHASRVDLQYLKFRSDQLQVCRQYMQEKGVMEVMTPLLRQLTATDPHIDSFKVGASYLQTSPELSMKILLGNHSGDIYQLSPVFRDEPITGPYHQTEFLMLEWYRLNIDERQLAHEVVELIRRLGITDPATFYDLRDAFHSFYGQDLWLLSDHELVMLSQEQMDIAPDLARQDYMELLIDRMVRALNKPLLVLLGFPELMQLMARFDQRCEKARRFEVYIHGHEIANGFYELNDAILQRKRMIQDNLQRKILRKPIMPLDEGFLRAVGQMPDCSGVALGLDRLIWLLLDQS